MQSISNSSDGLGTVYLPVFVSYLTGIIGFVAIGVNSLVVFAFLTDKEIRYVHANSFFFNMSVSDGMTGINLLINLVWIQLGTNVLPRESVPCILWGGWSVASAISSSLLAILISWDRLKMVSDPFKYRQFTRRRVVIQISVLWMYVLLDVVVLSFLVPFALELIFNRDVEVGICIIAELDSQAVYFSFVQDFLIPLTILTVINVMIAVRIIRVTVTRLENQRLEMGPGVISTPEEVNIDKSIPMKSISSTVTKGTFENRRTTSLMHVPIEHSSFRRTPDTRMELQKMHKTIKLLLLFVCIYIICWFPLYVGLIAKNFFDVPPWVIHLLALLVGVNAIINPFLYAFMSNKIRRRLKLMLRCRLR